MTTILGFKYLVDLPKWRMLAPPIAAIGQNGQQGLIYDMRNNEDRHPFIYYASDNSRFQAYNVKNDQWITVTNPGVSGYTNGFFMSAQGPRGTIAAGATTTSFTLTTALPATVGVNQLANRGDGRGFKVRIIGNSAGGSGKIEERLVVANTSGTTPTIVVDSAFSFTPAAGDAYEFLSGRAFTLSSTNAAGSWKYYDVLTNSASGNLATANLPASWTESILVGLDELLVPFDRNPGEGFFGVLTATGSAGTTLTGQVAGGDAGVVANQYRNFQIRIVQDTATPTAVGQRRNITSHTAGPSPVYTVPVWTVTPSATASYVIENNGDRIIAWTTADANTKTYTILGNAWDSNVTFAVSPTIIGFGSVVQQSFAIIPDSVSNARHSFIFRFRGASTTTIDLLDIAGAATGTWASAITYGNSTTIFDNGMSSSYDSATNEGRYMYICGGSSARPQNIFRFDVKNRVLEPSTFLKSSIATTIGAFITSRYLAWTVFIDGNTKLSFVIFAGSTITGPISFAAGLPITR